MIGEGAIAYVYGATHVTLESRVALKFLKPHCARDPESVARFHREARAVARLDNPHIATVIDVGEHEGVPFMAMEYLNGRDLRALLNERGPMPIREVADILVQVCTALADAHSHGIVHRDIKPENVFIVAPDKSWKSVKVLDFGISKFTEQAASKADKVNTGSHQIMGSPHYLSPEQVRCSRDVDARTDIWSVGVVAHELLTGGERPFIGENLAMLVMAILSSPPRSPSGAASHDPGFLAVIRRCLEKEPARRYVSAADLAFAFYPYAPQRSLQSVERARHLTPLATFAVPDVTRERNAGAEQASAARAANIRARLFANRVQAEIRHASPQAVAERETIPVPASGILGPVKHSRSS